MDYKALAQQTAQEILGYYQDTSGRKVVKTSVRREVKYVSRVCFLMRNNSLQRHFKKYFLLQTKKKFLRLLHFLFFIFSVSDS